MSPAHSHRVDNRFAAKEQQYLEFSLSAAPCPASLTHLIFIRSVNTARNHTRNERLYISTWETFGSLAE
jgi:hypothetical protein